MVILIFKEKTVRFPGFSPFLNQWFLPYQKLAAILKLKFYDICGMHMSQHFLAFFRVADHLLNFWKIFCIFPWEPPEVFKTEIFHLKHSWGRKNSELYFSEKEISTYQFANYLSKILFPVNLSSRIIMIIKKKKND